MKILNITASLVLNFNQIENDRVLLLLREKSPYQGNFALPGGKIEYGEELSEAAIRELYEESGIRFKTKPIHFALLNETLWEKGELTGHFIISYFLFTTKKNKLLVKNSKEGELVWIEIDKLHIYQDRIVPSDFKVLTDLLKEIKVMKNDPQTKLNNFDIKFYECKISSKRRDQKDDLKIISWKTL